MQDIYVFPGAHTRTKKHRGLRVDDLLETQDGDGDAKGPGLFLYTKGMPVTILFNINTPLGLVNGARGTAAGIVPHPDGKLLLLPGAAVSILFMLTPHSPVPPVRPKHRALLPPPHVRTVPTGHGQAPSVRGHRQ